MFKFPDKNAPAIERLRFVAPHMADVWESDSKHHLTMFTDFVESVMHCIGYLYTQLGRDDQLELLGLFHKRKLDKSPEAHRNQVNDWCDFWQARGHFEVCTDVHMLVFYQALVTSHVHAKKMIEELGIDSIEELTKITGGDPFGPPGEALYSTNNSFDFNEAERQLRDMKFDEKDIN